MFKIPNILNPKELFKTVSPISGEIKVVQIGKEKRLVVGGYVQSINWDCPGVEKRVWGKMANLALESNVNGKKILLLGLGAGTIVGLLYSKNPLLEITTIELDKDIIEIANKYFDLLKFKNLKIINGDVLDPATFNNLSNMDFIFVDVYCGGTFPENIWNKEFFDRLKKRLSKDGYVIFNRILDVSSNRIIDETKGFLLNFFSKVEFEKVSAVGSEGNVLFLCKK